MRATWRRALAAGLGAGLTALLISPPSTAAPARAGAAGTSPSAAARAGTAGACKDALGVSVVVDYQDLGAYGSSTGKTTTRCAPTQKPGKPFSGTALQALTAAGFTVTGTTRWGNAFVCRVQGRPAATEPIGIPGNPTYQEKCVDTPPAAAFWGSWHAANGGSWTYSTQGASTRMVTGGTFEGWSFSHNKTSGTNPPPRVTPKRPAVVVREPTSAARPGIRTTLQTTETPATRMATATPATRTATATAAATTNTASTSGDPAAARDWLLGQLRSDGSMPAPFGTGADQGLSIDALWALEATGATTAQVRHTWSSLASPQAVADFTGPGFYADLGPQYAGVRFGGQSAKLLLAAATVGADVTDVGGRDLRQQTLDLIATKGPQVGRISDVGTGSDNTNTISQALAVLGLAATGGAPQSAVDFLRSQQCSAGYFRMYANDDKTCDSAAKADATPDNDGSALAVQALMAAKADGSTLPQSAIDAGVHYLSGAQKSDGSFGGGVGTDGANTNSTGLSAATLQAGGDAAAAGRARAWVASLQATTTRAAGTALRSDIGAIAYDPTSWGEALTAGIGSASDQWRRATAQAVFALTPVTLTSLVGSISGPGPVQSSPPTSPTSPSSSSSSSSSTASSSHSSTPASRGTSTSSTRTVTPASVLRPPTGRGIVPLTAVPTSAPPVSSSTTTAVVPIAGTASSSPAPPAGAVTEAAGPALSAASTSLPSQTVGQNWLGLPPLVWAVALGLLLGALVVFRPWQLLPHGRHTR